MSLLNFLSVLLIIIGVLIFVFFTVVFIVIYKTNKGINKLEQKSKIDKKRIAEHEKLLAKLRNEKELRAKIKEENRIIYIEELQEIIDLSSFESDFIDFYRQSLFLKKYLNKGLPQFKPDKPFNSCKDKIGNSPGSIWRIIDEQLKVHSMKLTYEQKNMLKHLLESYLLFYNGFYRILSRDGFTLPGNILIRLNHFRYTFKEEKQLKEFKKSFFSKINKETKHLNNRKLNIWPYYTTKSKSVFFECEILVYESLPKIVLNSKTPHNTYILKPVSKERAYTNNGEMCTLKTSIKKIDPNKIELISNVEISFTEKLVLIDQWYKATAKYCIKNNISGVRIELIDCEANDNYDIRDSTVFRCVEKSLSKSLKTTGAN